MGIYMIICLMNDRRYVGQTIDFKKRWTIHRLKLNRSQHSNLALQFDYNRFGLDCFYFWILEEVEDHDFLLIRERKWINRNLGRSYNEDYRLVLDLDKAWDD